MREFTLGPLSESRLESGGRQLVRQAAKYLTFESVCRLNFHKSPFVLLLNHKVDTHLPSLGGWKAEST